MRNPRKDDICRRFGAAVRRRRLELGLTQEQLADHAGLHRTYVGDLERGRRNLALRNIERIIKALRISIGEFFSDYEVE